ncbi:MAG: hypothetical protein ABIZ80_02935, partial [Bryobacteraceae bacterium]
MFYKKSGRVARRLVRTVSADGKQMRLEIRITPEKGPAAESLMISRDEDKRAWNRSAYTMSFARTAFGLLLLSAVGDAQQYVISTCAGAGAPTGTGPALSVRVPSLSRLSHKTEWSTMKRQSFTGCAAQAISTCVLIALVSASSSKAQTDVACRQRQFGKFSEWSAAVSLGPVVNSPNLDFWPSISPNGLSLYFGSNRPGGIPGADRQDIWVTRRASLNAPWGVPRNLGPNINTAFRDNSPKLSRDGHWLIFGSSRPTGKCIADSVVEFYVSYRENAEDDFAWEPAVNFGCELSGKGENLSPAFFHDDDKGITAMYFSSPRAGDSSVSEDIYVSTRRFHGSFGPATLVPELNSAVADSGPTIRADGLEMFFKRGLPPPGPADLVVTTRETASQPWTTPKSLGPMVNSSAVDNQQPSLSCDGTTLFFSS